MNRFHLFFFFFFRVLSVSQTVYKGNVSRTRSENVELMVTCSDGAQCLQN